MQSIIKDVYKNLPYKIQQVAFNIKSWQNYKIRTGGKFKQYFNKHSNLWQKDLDEVKKYQRNQLIEILTYSYNHSEWFRKIFKEKKITAHEIYNEPYKVLSKIPFLKKDHIKKNLKQIVSSDPVLGKKIPNYTSGTTGSPMKTLASEDSEQRLHAIKKRFHTSVGVPFNNRCIRFSGNQVVSPSRTKPPFWQYNKYENVWFFSLYHFSKQNLPFYIKKLNEIKPHLMDGYPSGLYVLANYLLNNNIKLWFTPDAICTTAEPLTQLVRERIEKAFKCKVYNQYSSSEGAIFITECTEGKLHVNIDTGVAEYMNEDGKTGRPGEICELIITGFINKTTPLIRYKTGDRIKLSEKEQICSCGCEMPVISEIFGRFEDYLVDQNGIEQGMVSYRTFKMAENIIKAQIIQESQNIVNAKIVKDDNYSSSDEKFIVMKLHEILGDEMSIHVEYCQDIETGPNGKFKTVIRNFNEE